ncbi:PAS domain S-box protein [Acidobacteriota bacterium]
MNDKTKEQHTDELSKLRKRIRELEKTEILQKKTADALKESEEKYRAIFESANDAIFLMRGEEVIECNPETLSIFGCDDKSDIIGHTPMDFSPEKQPDGVASKKKAQEYITAISQGTPQRFYWKHIRMDGSPFDAEVSLNRLVVGGITHILAITRDISGQKRTEEEIKNSEERLKILFESAPDAYYLSDLKGNFIDGNNAAENLLSYKRDELRGKNFLKLKLLSAKDISKAAKLLAKNITGHGTGPDEFTLHRKDGTNVIAEIRTYPVKIKEKTVVLGIARDINERKQAEVALQESEEKFRSISDSAQDAIIMMDNREKISYWNKAAEKIFGYAPQEAIGKEMSVLLAPQYYHKAHQDGLSKFKTMGKGIPVGKVLELIALKKDGEEFPIELSVSMTKLKGERHVIGIIRDITERIQAEEELQKREAHQALVLRSLPMAFYVAQPFGDYGGTWVSEQIGNISGFTAKQFMEDSHLWASRLHPDERDRVLEEFEKILEKEAIAIEYRWQASGGKYIWFLDSGVLIRDEKGNPIEIIGTWLDITERKKEREKLEESLTKLQKAISGNIQLMATTVEIRDPYTAGHQKRVAELARAIAVEMALPEDQVEGVYMAGVIHDLGKISVPSEILSKPGKLSEIEFRLIKSHPQVGFDILKEIEFPWPIAKIVYQHHERMNGSGYPQGLSSENTLLEARIMCVADVVEAMASHRPYRPTLGIDVALEEIKTNSTTLYDPEVVNACLNLFNENRFAFKD